MEEKSFNVQKQNICGDIIFFRAKLCFCTGNYYLCTGQTSDLKKVDRMTARDAIFCQVVSMKLISPL